MEEHKIVPIEDISSFRRREENDEFQGIEIIDVASDLR